MLKKPKLKKFLTIFPISDTTWGLRGGSDELWRLKLRNEEAANALSLLSYLNGKYGVEEITDLMATKGVEAGEVSTLLQQLHDASLIEEADPFGLSEEEEKTFNSQITFFSRYTSDGGAKYQARLRESRVGIIGDGYLAKTIRRQLTESGFGEILLFSSDPQSALASLNGHNTSAGNGTPATRVLELDRDSVWAGDDQKESLPALFFVAQEAEDPQVLEAMDRLSKRRNVPWMLVRALESHVGWVGPLFIPGETACYETLEARLRSNLSYFPEYQAFSNYLRGKSIPGAECGGLHVFFELLGAIAVCEAIKFLGNLTVPTLAGRFLTVNMSHWDVETHEVLRVPSIGLEVTEPKLFAWKEMPADSIKANDEGNIYSRRS
jgi:bacteriocin biosynthesis cyclodehydratase domain-containing protein